MLRSSSSCTQSDQRIICSRIVQYPMIKLADNEGPDQTAHAQSDQGLLCPITA